MCGIVGYIGNEQAVPVLINGLTKLEYRGYDSAGIAMLKADQVEVVKAKGRLKKLEEKLENYDTTTTVGIGHTRWATHGAPNETNSHPHVSQNGKIAIVHNGIIENYLPLREYLSHKGYTFKSETDTEVVAHLIEHYYKGDLIQAVIQTLDKVEGAYALGVVCADNPEEMVAARKDSPLIVGLGENENFIASDIPAILDYTRDIYIIEDKEIARITKDDVTLYNLMGEEISRDVFHVEWDVEVAEKGGYEHFMMKEMCEEPDVVKATASPRIQDNSIVLDNIVISKEELESYKKIVIVACGTAWHAGVVAKYVIEKLCGISVETDVASEFRYRAPIVDENCLTIIISQSGETLDTLMALREAKKKGSKIISIVNVVGSSIARDSDYVLYTWAGQEIAVASTKAYNTQLTALYLLAIKFAHTLGKLSQEQYTEYISALMEMPKHLEKVLQDKKDIQHFAAEHFASGSVFFIGRGIDYALSMEGSLKLKEISYIHSEAYAGGELKHGTIALIEEGTLVICPLTQEALFDKMISNMVEVKARGAIVLAITPEKHMEEVAKVADQVITIPNVNPLLAPIVAVTPMQLFAYYVSVAKGCDVDKPRNLAKSVTVE